MQKIINTRISQRHDSEFNWNSIPSFVPLNGEMIIYDADEKYSYPRIKFGDGINFLKDLPFVVDVEAIYKKIDSVSLPDIESSDDVLVKLLQLNNKIETLTDIINTLTARIDSLIPSVGEVYISFSNNDPSIKFGGVWEQIKDRFLLACGEKYLVESVGGESEHILTIDELPSHGHEFLRHQLWRNEDDQIDSSLDEGYGVSNKTLDIYRDTTDPVGGNQPHNNMPPYTAVYMWRRIQ